LTLKMEATYSSKTSVYFQWATQHYILEDRTVYNHCCWALKSYGLIFVIKFGCPHLRNVYLPLFGLST
jgi:hypothetical protein